MKHVALFVQLYLSVPPWVLLFVPARLVAISLVFLFHH